MTADPSVTEQVAEVLRVHAWQAAFGGCPSPCEWQASEDSMDEQAEHATHVAEALAAAGLTPQGTTVEEWGVRTEGGTVVPGDVQRHWPEAHQAGDCGCVLVRRTRTTYPDRVSEWQPAPDTTHPQPDRPGTESKEQG